MFILFTLDIFYLNLFVVIFKLTKKGKVQIFYKISDIPKKIKIQTSDFRQGNFKIIAGNTKNFLRWWLVVGVTIPLHFNISDTHHPS